MYCPGCGINEEKPVQFCRACGLDLRALRGRMLAADDAVAVSAAEAKEDVVRAIAARIKTTDDFHAVEDILGEVTKFLETAPDKRLRRLRRGVITACIGLGTALAFILGAMATNDTGMLMMSAMGIITMFIGLGILLNGLFFTVGQHSLPAKIDAARLPGKPALTDRTLQSVQGVQGEMQQVPSVVEHTTRRLSHEQ